MRKILFAFILLLPFTGYSQKTNDVIYLNNGSIIKGQITNNDNSIVTIETFCGNTFVYEVDDVREITKEKHIPFQTLKNKGYYNYTSMGGLIGSENDEKTTTFSILMEHNYQLNKNFAVGAVTGIEWFTYSVAPLGANIKLTAPLEYNMGFYLGFSGGYSIPLEEFISVDYEIKETKGGYFFNSEIGLIFPSMGNANLYIAMGYRYQDLRYVREDWWLNEVERKTTYNRFSLKVGVCLH